MRCPSYWYPTSKDIPLSESLLNVLERGPLIERTPQHPESIPYINQLEDHQKYDRSQSVDETSGQGPQFIRHLHDQGDIHEGRHAHFEAQITPVSDPTMKVEWYKDGKAITASKRRFQNV